MESTASAIRLTARTADFRQRMEQRRHDLRQELDAILRPDAAFVWEIGCGHGHYLTAYAQAHPGVVCIGIDIMGERIERARRKRDRAHLNNLFFIQADARLFLEVIPFRCAFSRLFILFPDPWPKVRHRKHRILKPDFLAAAARRAAPDARLYFRTDFAPYFHEAQTMVVAHEAWDMIAEPWPFEFSTVFQARATHHHSLIARRRRDSLPAIS